MLLTAANGHRATPNSRSQNLYTNLLPRHDTFGTHTIRYPLPHCERELVRNTTPRASRHATAQRRSVYEEKVSFFCRRISGRSASHSDGSADHDLRASHERGGDPDPECHSLPRRHESRDTGRPDWAL